MILPGMVKFIALSTSYLLQLCTIDGKDHFFIILVNIIQYVYL